MENSSKGKEVVKSSMLKAGRRTYFFDVKLSLNSAQSSHAPQARKYLKITESVFMGEGKPRRYNSFLLFPEVAQNFKSRLDKIVLELQ